MASARCVSDLTRTVNSKQTNRTHFQLKCFPRLHVHLFQSSINSDPAWTLQTLSTQSWSMMCLAAFVRASSLPLPVNVNSQFIVVSQVCACQGRSKSKFLHIRVSDVQIPMALFSRGIGIIAQSIGALCAWRFTTQPIHKKRTRWTNRELDWIYFDILPVAGSQGLPDHSSPGISNKPISEPFLK